MVLPDPGFHAGLRALATKYGTLLIIDETHTLSSGLGGYTRVHSLTPDIFVAGKAVAGGMPTAVWGMTDAIATRLDAVNAPARRAAVGMGTTLSANPMQFACLKATLAHAMTPAAYAHMEAGAERLAAGLSAVIDTHMPCPGTSPASARGSS